MKSIGVSRMFDNEKAVLVSFDRRPTDDELRAIHERLRFSTPPEGGETVCLPRQHLQDALNYINHVGSGFVMSGQPHPQQWIVDNLNTALAPQKEGA